MRLRRWLAVLGVGLIAAVQPVGSTAFDVPAGPTAMRGMVSSCAPKHYRVRAGDTLSSIARRFQTSVAALAAANSLDPDGLLRAGLVLVLPATGCLALHTAPAAPEGDRLAAALRRRSRFRESPGRRRASSSSISSRARSSTP